jgi:glutathione S-transferase
VNRTFQVELALRESKLEHTRFEVDLQNKPEWYAPKINLASKVRIVHRKRKLKSPKPPVLQVPAVTYGGPKVAADEPSPQSQKIAESLVLLEFVADLSGKLLPKDAVQRARVRFFIDAVSNSFAPLFYNIAVRGESPETIFKGLEVIQALLPAEGLAVGPEFTIADAAIAPFIARLELALKNDLGAYEEGHGVKAFESLQTNPKFARYRKYLADLKARDSFKETFDEVCTSFA